MAGQIEEPFSFNFQANSVHSGSISFGRFANEPLLWERRSSFSHSRILEEVARCSEHRIVTEKKAYFEAQFKKRALLRQSSLDEHNGTQYENGEKDSLDLSSHKKDSEFFQGNENDASCDTSVNMGGCRVEFDYPKEAEVDVQFDDSLDTSIEFDEKEMIDYQVEGRETLIAETLGDPSSESAEATTKVNDRAVAPVEVQTVIDCTYSRCKSVEPDEVLEQNIYGGTCCADEDYKAINSCGRSLQAEKELDTVSGHKNPSPKFAVATEPSGTDLHDKVARTQRHGLSEADKKSFRSLIRDVKKSAHETKTFGHSKLNPRSTANKWTRSPNSANLLTQPKSSISKSESGSKCGSNESKGIRITESRVTTLKKDPPTAHQTLNRPEKIPTSNKSGLKTSPTSFRFKFEVRAEKRKELVTTKELKVHNKETEIDKTRTKTQEKTEVEIKQFRRGSNFKAKPMPPSCNEARRKDAMISKLPKSPSKVMSKVASSKPMHLKADSGLSNSLSQLSKVGSYPERKPTKTGVVSPSGKKYTHPSDIRNVSDTTKLPGIDRGAKLQNLKVLPNAEVIRGRGTSGTPRPVNERTSKCTTRKVIEQARPLRNVLTS
uniref:TPX2 C-terminal domain-containing protein n=1 Tax=Kalanchoe fedtschenkoi TaxID=63787 RepID=A0A7N0VKC2_KALFE